MNEDYSISCRCDHASAASLRIALSHNGTKPP